MSADHADPERDSTHDDNRSVLTGLTNDELEAEPRWLEGANLAWRDDVSDLIPRAGHYGCHCAGAVRPGMLSRTQ